jgi:hypothetical protein
VVINSAAEARVRFTVLSHNQFFFALVLVVLFAGLISYACFCSCSFVRIQDIGGHIRGIT